MTGVSYQHPMPAPCPRCTGYGDAHYLTCPTLRLPPQSQWFWLRTLEDTGPVSEAAGTWRDVPEEAAMPP